MNPAKTELTWFGSSTSLQSMSSLDRSIVVVEVIIQPSNSVRNLGVQFDSEMNMCAQIAKTTQTFFHIRQVRSVLGRQVAGQLVSALVISRLDYGNGTLAGLPQSSLEPLQRVLNASAHLVCDLHPPDSVTSALIGLHWLPVPAQSLHGSAPHYINAMLYSRYLQ